ncbi:MAG TPA: hypothetical protein GX743_05495, partial [Actinomycetales bacterium]|nr:hypothetical protein [Actinomycetales bacterium]
MRIVDDRIIWTASDLALASQCEYALLRNLDYQLGRAPREEAAADPFMDHIAALGERNEARILEAFQASRQVAEPEPAALPLTRLAMQQAAERTAAALAENPDVVYQAAFFDGEFFGYADFLERTPAGWMV